MTVHWLVYMTCSSRVVFSPHACVFWRCLWLFCLCVKYLENRTAERICDKFTRKTCLVPRSDETSLNVRVKGQRSRTSGTKTGFSALMARPVCVFSSSSVGFCICFFIVCLYCSLFLQPTVLFTILCQKLCIYVCYVSFQLDYLIPADPITPMNRYNYSRRTCGDLLHFPRLTWARLPCPIFRIFDINEFLSCVFNNAAPAGTPAVRRRHTRGS